MLIMLLGCNTAAMLAGHIDRKAERHGFTSQVAELGPHSVHYWEGGEGPVVLLLHGFGGDATWHWEPLMEALAEDHRVIAPDLLWFGDSTSQAEPTLEAQVDAMLRLLDHEKVERADVVGLSYGGFTTFGLLHAQPERVGRVVIMDSPGPMYTPEQRAAAYERLDVADPTEVFIADEPADLRKLYEICLEDPPAYPDWVLQDALEAFYGTGNEQRRALMHDLQARPVGEWTPPREPSLVVWGEGDELFTLDEARALAALISAELVVIPGTRHAPNLEKPEETAAPIVAFLR